MQSTAYGKKTWLVMKLTALLLIAATFQVNARGYSQNITLNLKNVSLQKAFSEIERQSGFNFIYDKRQLAKASPVSVALSNMPLESALKTILHDQPLQFSIHDKFIVVSSRSTSGNMMETTTGPAPPPLETISGVVKDEKGNPLSGVTIQVEGKNSAVISDENGHFQLRIQQDATLIFSFVGYRKEIIHTTAGQKEYTVTLKLLLVELENMVVVGFGTQKKTHLIGSVAQVSGEQIARGGSVPQLSQALAGQLPGVTIIQSSGQPGASGGTVQIRGVGSFGATTAPLILVDGIPTNDYNDIDPNDVAEVSVLKDASTAAIYGARAANGVILITTKMGKTDKLKISYNGYAAIQKPTTYPKFVNSAQYATLMNEVTPGSYTPDQIQKFKDGSDPYNYPNTNWLNTVFSNSTIQTGHNISISNGSKNSQYLLSLGYMYQNGIVTENNYNRYNIRFNLTSNLAQTLKLTTRLSAVQTLDHEPAAPPTLGFSDMSTIISQVIRFPAIYSIKAANGDWGLGMANNGTPASYLGSQSFYKDKNTNLEGSLRLDWDVIKGLKLSAIGGYTQMMDRNTLFQATQRLTSAITLGPSNLTETNNNSYYKTIQLLANYQKQFGKHGFNLLGGYSFESAQLDGLTAYRSNLPDNTITVLNVGDASTQTNTGASYEWALESYFGRLQYNYDSKYLVEGVVRRDGSSRFPPTDKYGTFPSVAVGWRLGQEKFIKDNVSWIDELKLKASYGTLGNQGALTSSGSQNYYPYQNLLYTGYNYAFGNTITTGVARTTITDTALHWESTRTKDAGIEMSIFNKLLSFSATYFDRYTYDILVSPGSSVSSVLGFNVGVQNSGRLSNKGWEFTMEHRNTIGQFAYTIGGNFSILTNKVLDLGVGNIKQPNGMVGNGNNLFVGQPMGIYYGYVASGLFKDAAAVSSWADQSAIAPKAQPGDIRYADLGGANGKDGKVTADYDRKVIGSTIPKYAFGVTLGGSYKGFDLNVLLQGVAGVSGYLNAYAGYAFNQNGNVQQWQMDDRWTVSNPNPNAKYPRLESISNTGTNNTLVSSYWVLNAAYLRIKSVQLGYNLPKSWMTHLGIERARVYLSGYNLYTFNHFRPGWDPETSGGFSSGNTANTVGGSYYPILANYSFGINLNF